MTKAPPLTSCLLPRLADIRLSGVFPGLLVDSGGFVSVDGKVFGCCGGNGVRLSATGDLTVTCDLAKRFRSARYLAFRYASLQKPQAEGAFASELKRGAGPSSLVSRLAMIAKGQTQRGQVTLADPSVEALPPSPWAMAMMAAWRFGLLPHVALIGKTPASEILPDKTKAAPRVLFVGNVDKLWEAREADAFEALVSYAYASLTPLFFELVVRPKAPSPAGGETRSGATSQAFSRKLKDISARSPLSWLAPDCVSKLAHVTDGLSTLINDAQKEQRRKHPPKAKMPRLPWD